MSFDFMAFAEGFATTKTQEILRQKDKAQAKEERLRALAERNAPIMQARQSVYTNTKNMGDWLLSQGAKPEMIQAAVKSGQQGLANLYKTVQSVPDELRKDFLNDETLISYDIGNAAPVDIENLTTLYKQASGIPTGAAVGDLKADKPSPLEQIFGSPDYTKSMQAELDAELSGVGGYSVYDLTTLGTVPEYMPGSQGEMFTLVQPKIYSSANYTEETETLQNIVTNLPKLNPAYDTARKAYEEAERTLLATKDAADSAEYKQLEEQRNKAKAEMDAIAAPALQMEIDRRAAAYYNPTLYLKQMRDFLQTTTGSVPTWLEEDIATSEEVEKIVDATMGDGAGDQTDEALGETPSYDVAFTIKDSQGNEFNIVTVAGQSRIQTLGGQLLSAEATEEILKSTDTTEAVEAEEEPITRANIYKTRKSNLEEDTQQETSEETYNPRAIGTVGFRDFGLREDVRQEAGLMSKPSAEPFEEALTKVLAKVDEGTPVTKRQLKTFVKREIAKSNGVFTPEDTDIIMDAIKRKLGM